MADNNQNKAAAPVEERELTEKEIGEQRQIKRKKLEELREAGRIRSGRLLQPSKARAPMSARESVNSR